MSGAEALDLVKSIVDLIQSISIIMLCYALANLWKAQKEK